MMVNVLTISILSKLDKTPFNYSTAFIWNYLLIPIINARIENN